jgi:hydroxypyruvate reductase
VVEVVARGVRGDLTETVKSLPQDHQIECVGSNATSLDAIEQAVCSVLPELPELLVVRESEPLLGEARLVADQIFRRLQGVAGANQVANDRRPRLYIAGGETTVTLTESSGRDRGDSLGGRNQEMALAFVLAAAAEVAPDDGAGERPQWVFLSAGTDGLDGPTDAAGAIVDSATVGLMRGKGVDPAAALARHDSYHALDSGEALLRTGATGTNVGDIQLLLTWYPPS